MIHLLYAIFYLLLVFSPLKKLSKPYLCLLFFVTLLIHLIAPIEGLLVLAIILVIPKLLSWSLRKAIGHGYDCLAFKFSYLLGFLGFDNKRVHFLLSQVLDDTNYDLPALNYKTNEELILTKKLYENNINHGLFIDEYELLDLDQKNAYEDLYIKANQPLLEQKLKCTEEL